MRARYGKCSMHKTDGKMNKQERKELEAHFEFGENWERYSVLINDERIREAGVGLAKLVPKEELCGKSFLDIGCGSGLHSLAAAHMGTSRILAIDLDPKSVATAEKILNRYAQETDSTVLRASVFDLRPDIHGQFEVVYSWGVLHHTGSMNEAISLASRLVKPGGLFVFALYRKTLMCRFWAWEKRWYTKTSPGMQKFARSLYLCLFKGNMFLSRKSFRSYLQEYQKNRGMDFFHDVHDWMGGYPYESIAPDEVDRLMERLGFALERRFLLEDSIPLKLGFFGSGNDEYVYRRRY